MANVAPVPRKCSVYLNQSLLDLSLDRITRKTPTPQRIGDIWARAIQTFSDSSLDSQISLLGRLGVDLKDEEAHARLIPIMQQAISGDVKINPSKEDSGVYFLSKDGKRFAVFKVGTRRMVTESLARKIALRTGLEKHAIPGVYCTIVNPRILQDDEVSEELWNGNVKVFKGVPAHPANDDPLTMTGILEPYLSEDEKITPDDICSMTFLAFLLGLRDGKLDGKFGSRFVDLEDIFPLRLLPFGESPNKAVAASHLPYLSDPLAKLPISREKLIELAKKAEEIESHIFHLLAELENEVVEFADEPSERLLAFRDGVRPTKELRGRDQGIDHGGFAVQTIQQKKILEDHPTINLEQTDHLLSKEQLRAFDDRLTNLKKFIDLCVRTDYLPSAVEMISNADQMYGAHLVAIMKKRPERAQTAFDLVGYYPPDVTGSRLDEEDRREILRASPPSMARSTSGSSRELFGKDDRYQFTPLSGPADDSPGKIRRVLSSSDISAKAASSPSLPRVSVDQSSEEHK
jgi:hypothetical protein